MSPSRVILKVLRFQEARRSVRDSNIPLIDEEDEETSFENKDDLANNEVAAVAVRLPCVPSIDDTVRSDYSVEDKEIDVKEVRFQNICIECKRWINRKRNSRHLYPVGSTGCGSPPPSSA